MNEVIFTINKNLYSSKEKLVLNQKDINFINNIYKKYKIKPESVSIVSCDIIIQRFKLIRYVFKQLDILLKVNGIFEIDLVDSKFHSSSFLSRDQVKYEFGISTNGRYSLIYKNNSNGFLKLRFKKNKKTLISNDSIDKWTFGIPSGGKNDDLVNNLISSIIKQKIPNYEIIICGIYNKKLTNKNIIILDDINLNDDIRIPICHKKNKIIKSAKYENICILHDRFSLSKNWYKNIVNFGNYFDFLCMPTFDKYGNRFYVDWMKFNDPIVSWFKRNNHLKYNQWHNDVIVQGGFLISKKNILLNNLLDERIYWEELEDFQMSKMAYLNGYFICIDRENHIISESVNHIPQISREGFISEIINYFKWVYAILKNMIYFKNMTKKFKKK